MYRTRLEYKEYILESSQSSFHPPSPPRSYVPKIKIYKTFLLAFVFIY